MHLKHVSSAEEGGSTLLRSESAVWMTGL